MHRKTESGRTIDLTREAEYVTSASSDIFHMSSRGVVSGKNDGDCEVTVRVRGMERSVNVSVTNSQVPRKFHWKLRNHLLSRWSCKVGFDENV